MNTYTGRRFQPLEITLDDICIEDIAHALSLLCRGGGHLQYFYTVAQHSVNCSFEAEKRGYEKRLQLACLLHDASEAYISDMIRPVKEHLHGYLEIEERIMNKIWEKYGLGDLSEEEHQIWKQIDDDMLACELKAMMVGPKKRIVPSMASVPELCECSWREMNRRFLERFASLYEGSEY